MFDSVKFGVAIVAPEEFENLDQEKLRYLSLIHIFVTAVVLFFYRLNKKRYNEIVEELKNGRKS